MHHSQRNITDTKNDILKILDKVIETGRPVTVERKGKHLIISPSKASSKLEQLEEHLDYIKGEPEAIVHMDWSTEWKHPL